jgi:hypothetical protein
VGEKIRKGKGKRKRKGLRKLGEILRKIRRGKKRIFSGTFPVRALAGLTWCRRWSGPANGTVAGPGFLARWPTAALWQRWGDMMRWAAVTRVVACGIGGAGGIHGVRARERREKNLWSGFLGNDWAQRKDFEKYVWLSKWFIKG